MKSSSNVDREGINHQKIIHFLEVVFLGRTRKADVYLDRFSDFDVDRLEALTKKRIRAVLLDIDACVAPAYLPVLEENIVKIRELVDRGIRVGVYSNCKNLPRLKYLKSMRVPIYSGSISKPSREGFLEACRQFGFDANTTWMTGDNPNTDGGAVGELGGMAFVKAIPDDPKGLDALNLSMSQHIAKKIKIFFQNFFRAVGRFMTLVGNGGIIRSRDL